MEPPPYLGRPRHAPGCIIYDKIGVCEYYKIVPSKVVRYEMHAILEDGKRVEVEVMDLKTLVFKENLVQLAIDRRFKRVSKHAYLEWTNSLIFGDERPPSHFSLVISGIPGIIQRSVWCSRWPTEAQIQSLMRHPAHFEIKILLC